MTIFYVIMGVSGCGKSTIGQALADQLDCPFYDGDDFHPPENVAKMSSGIPLNDADRAPWLARLAELIATHWQRGETAVLACSALKKRYRDQLRVNSQVQFVHLAGNFDLIWQRMLSRPGHYMKADMLQSQFDTLEPPDAHEAMTISIDQQVAAIVAEILQPTNSPG
ncbi:MAG: gluconokinase [Chloroflexota bacterium]